MQWFPTQFSTNIYLNMMEAGDSSISISVGNSSHDENSIYLLGVYRSNISDINFNSNFKRREFSQFNNTISKNATKQDDDFWEKYRTLTEKDLKTYQTIDSLGEEFKLDQKAEILEIVASGNIPIKFINIDLKDLYLINGYETFRLGLPIETNDRFSRFISIGAYGGYGFGDKQWKYGSHLKFNIHRPSYTSLKFGFSQDIEFSDYYCFYGEMPAVSFETLARKIFLSEADLTKKIYSSLNFTLFKYLQGNLSYNYQEKHISNQIRYDFISNIDNFIYTSDFTLKLRYAYKEKFMRTPRGNRISLGTTYPIAFFNATYGTDLFLANNEYFKLEAKLKKKFLIRNFGETIIDLTGGYIFGDVPYTNLYYAEGSRYNVNSDLGLSVNNTFNTMRIDEFISDKFANIFISHDFGSLLFSTKSWKPQLLITTAIGWGNNSRIGELQNETFAKKMNKGFYESGIQINNILSTYGVGIYYRYGPYALTKEINNWAFKISIKFNLW